MQHQNANLREAQERLGLSQKEVDRFEKIILDAIWDPLFGDEGFKSFALLNKTPKDAIAMLMAELTREILKHYLRPHHGVF